MPQNNVSLVIKKYYTKYDSRLYDSILNKRLLLPIFLFEFAKNPYVIEKKWPSLLKSAHSKT